MPAPEHPSASQTETKAVLRGAGAEDDVMSFIIHATDSAADQVWRE